VIPDRRTSTRFAPDGSTEERSNVVLLGWAALFSGMAQEMVYPLVPTFVVVALASSRASLGAVEGALAVGVTLARLASARLVDRGFSPRRLTRCSYGLSLAARPLMALAPTVGVVGGLRVVDGLGKGGKDAPRDLLVAADAGATGAGRSFGLQRALDTFGSVLGPVVAGGLLLLVGHGASGLRLVFALAALPGVGAVWMLRRVHDVPPTVHRDAERARLGRPFVMLLVAVTVFGLGNSSDTLLLLRAGSVGFSAAGLAFIYAAFNLSYALLALPAGALSDHIGRRPLLLVGWATYALVYTGFAFAQTGWQVLALFLAYGVYFASAEGTLKAWIVTMVPPQRRGAAYGLLAAASGLLMLPASVLAGWLWDRYGPRPAFMLGALLSTAALAVIALAPSLRSRALDVTTARPTPDVTVQP
jgi:MFS family permease